MDTNPSIFPHSENPNPKRKQFGDLPYTTHAEFVEFVEASKRLKEEAKGGEEPNIVRGNSAIKTSSWNNLNFPVFTDEILAYVEDEPQHATMRGEPPQPYKHSPPKETISTDTSVAYLRSHELPPIDDDVDDDEPQHATMRGERPQSYKHSTPKETISTDTSIAYLRSHELFPVSDDEPQHATIRCESPQPYKHSPPKETISARSIIGAEPAKAEDSTKAEVEGGSVLNMELEESSENVVENMLGSVI